MKDDILKSYEKSNNLYFANSNSLHELGLNSKKLENTASKQILDTLKLSDFDIMYTSGNNESYTFLLNAISNDKEIVTDNIVFYEIGLLMGKNIKYGNVLNLVSNNTYFISTCSFLDLYSYNCLKHIAISSYIPKLNTYDFITMDEDIPFFGVVIYKKNKEFIPIIHGGKSTTKYRAGTAVTPLIVSFSKLIKYKYKK